MNMKLLNKVIESYEDRLDEPDKERLAFFKGIWEEMDRWSDGSIAADYAYPDEERIREAWSADEPVLSIAPCTLSRERLATIFDALTAYVCAAGVLSEADATALAGIDGAGLMGEREIGLAGTNPEGFLDAIVSALEERETPGEVVGLVAVIAMLALRVELEPIAVRLKKGLPQSSSHHRPLRCPVCGSAPALARVGGESSPTDGRGRTLYCQQCGCEWDFERIRCARCGTRNQGHLHYFNIEGDDGHRIATCDECGSYIRTVFIEEALAPFSFEVEEVITARLDALARDPRFQASGCEE